MKLDKYALIGAFLFVLACRKPYRPVILDSSKNILVVEGLIAIGPDSTKFNLSRTVEINSETITNPESGATVTVEDDAKKVYPLIAKGGGNYYADRLNLGFNQKYRLHIVAQNGHEYFSDFVQAKVTPVIDSISWKAEGNALKLFATSHDPDNKTRYYRFDYQETWQFHSEYPSLFYSDGQKILPRDLSTSDNIYNCWQSNQSKNVLLGSTVKLSQDLLFELPLASVPSTEEKLQTKYSVLVREYALSPEAYLFWSNLKTITEQLGNIFDAQPSSLPGNIHCASHPGEQVIGFVSASTISKKRLFIDRPQLPAQWQSIHSSECKLDSVLLERATNGGVPVNEANLYFFTVPPKLIPTTEIRTPRGKLIGYFGSSPPCVDCTLRGTNVRPPFWQ